uniref:Uncharacterized protein n=1 Tax=Tanacetum cinerariifolium TaxID=118510 RepID=A0A6L2MQG1_TANCI|nr:hypothetical protein [Tanacetum cinerariifolium]
MIHFTREEMYLSWGAKSFINIRDKAVIQSGITAKEATLAEVVLMKMKEEFAHAKSGATNDTSRSYQLVLSLLVDENAIRLLLKEQSYAFTVHLATIHVELQATKGMVQARHGGGGDQASTIL